MSVLSASEIEQAAARLEGGAPADTLAWAAGTFPRLALATGFGVEGCALVHLVASRQLPIDIFTLDTGLLFPETYALWQRLECRYGLRIRAVEPALSVADQSRQHGARLWNRDPNRCCAMRKVEPLRRHLAGYDGWITAIRRDQTATRASARVVEWDASFGLVKINPLVAWTTREVWQLVSREQVPYNALYDRGFSSIGCEPCTTAVGADEDPRAGRWRGRAKDECGLHVRPAGPMAGSG